MISLLRRYSIDVIGKSDEEIKNIYKVNPKGLTVDEILYAATLTDDNEQRIQIYDTAASLYPNDYRTFNNLGMCQFLDQDYDAAQACFQQAAKIAPESGEAQMNLGLVALLNNNYKEATAKFGNAAGVPALADALAPTTYHIAAVLGARTNNSDMVYNNLREAFKLDKSLVNQAKTDLEFSRFNINSLF